MIKILEDVGIPVSTFRRLQDDAVERIHKSTKSLRDAAVLFERAGLGGPAKIPSLFLNLDSVLELKVEEREEDQDQVEGGDGGGLDPFLRHLEGLAVAEALKSIKFKARIPLPSCVTLVGVADEGTVTSLSLSSRSRLLLGHGDLI